MPVHRHLRPHERSRFPQRWTGLSPTSVDEPQSHRKSVPRRWGRADPEGRSRLGNMSKITINRIKHDFLGNLSGTMGLVAQACRAFRALGRRYCRGRLRVFAAKPSSTQATRPLIGARDLEASESANAKTRSLHRIFSAGRERAAWMTARGPLPSAPRLQLLAFSSSPSAPRLQP